MSPTIEALERQKELIEREIYDAQFLDRGYIAEMNRLRKLLDKVNRDLIDAKISNFCERS